MAQVLKSDFLVSLNIFSFPFADTLLLNLLSRFAPHYLSQIGVMNALSCIKLRIYYQSFYFTLDLFNFLSFVFEFCIPSFLHSLILHFLIALVLPTTATSI